MSGLMDPTGLLASKQLLDQLLGLQYTFQGRLGTWERIKDDPAARQQFLNQVFLAVQEETIEIMKETGYKNPDLVPFGWKKTQVENPEKFRAELIDLLHFWLTLAIAAGFRTGDEIFAAYAAKNGINHTRQDEGY